MVRFFALTAVIFLYFVWLLRGDRGIRAAIRYNIKALALMVFNDYIASASVSINNCMKLFLAYQIMYTVAWIHCYFVVSSIFSSTIYAVVMLAFNDIRKFWCIRRVWIKVWRYNIWLKWYPNSFLLNDFKNKIKNLRILTTMFVR